MRKLFLLEDDLSLISGLTFAFKKQFSHDSLSFLRFVCPTGSKAL